MTRWIGEGALVLAALASVIGVLAGLAACRRARWLPVASSAALAQTAALAAATACLLAALLRSNMAVAYVADHTERSLPVAFKLAALWAGQEGSLLLWALLLSLAGTALVLNRWHESGARESVTRAVFSGLGLFFTLLLLTAARPFAAPWAGPMDDGAGLNPMLQHWAMVLHPPTLLAGYACSSVPFVLAIAGLVAGDRDGAWLRGVRAWAMASWLFLTCGILLGAWWAYVELGWGGYWAWDPVENASLMPWLAVTALLHSIVIAQERGLFRGWAAVLACLAFALCVTGTTLTRSGLLASVHAFGRTTVGLPLAVLLAVLVLGACGLLWWRRDRLRAERELSGPLGRDGLILALNVLLVAMLGATLIGTLFPVVSGAIAGIQIAVAAPYYNRVVGTLGLAAAAVMSVGPAAVYGEGSAIALRRSAMFPGAIAGLVALGLLLSGVRHPAALACAAIATVTLLIAATDLTNAVRAHRASSPGMAWARAVAGTLDGSHRRYGGQLAHAGLCVLLIGLCGSGLYAERSEHNLAAGGSAQVGPYSVRYDTLGETRGKNYNAIEAVLVATDRRGGERELRPQRRYYDKAMEPISEVALWTRPTGDLYVVLAGWSPGGAEAAFSIVVNPLVMWIWVGGGMMALGGLFGLAPKAFGVRTMPVTESTE